MYAFAQWNVRATITWNVAMVWYRLRESFVPRTRTRSNDSSNVSVCFAAWVFLFRVEWSGNSSRMSTISIGEIHRASVRRTEGATSIARNKWLRSSCLTLSRLPPLCSVKRTGCTAGAPANVQRNVGIGTRSKWTGILLVTQWRPLCVRSSRPSGLGFSFWSLDRFPREFLAAVFFFFLLF